MHEPGGEWGGEEPLAICVSGLLGVPEAHPPPGMGQQQSRGTPSSPAMMSRLRLHLRPLQLGGEKERVAAVGSLVGQLPHTLWQQILLVWSPLKESWGPHHCHAALQWVPGPWSWTGTPVPESLDLCTCQAVGGSGAGVCTKPGVAAHPFQAALTSPIAPALEGSIQMLQEAPAAVCNAMVKVVPAQLLYPQGRRTQPYPQLSAQGLMLPCNQEE